MKRDLTVFWALDVRHGVLPGGCREPRMPDQMKGLVATNDLDHCQAEPYIFINYGETQN